MDALIDLVSQLKTQRQVYREQLRKYEDLLGVTQRRYSLSPDVTNGSETPTNPMRKSHFEKTPRCPMTDTAHNNPGFFVSKQFSAEEQSDAMNQPLLRNDQLSEESQDQSHCNNVQVDDIDMEKEPFLKSNVTDKITSYTNTNLDMFSSRRPEDFSPLDVDLSDTITSPQRCPSKSKLHLDIVNPTHSLLTPHRKHLSLDMPNTYNSPLTHGTALFHRGISPSSLHSPFFQNRTPELAYSCGVPYLPHRSLPSLYSNCRYSPTFPSHLAHYEKSKFVIYI